MRRILIVGASGYIGSRLAFLLAKEGHSVTALCYPDVPDDKSWVHMMSEVIVGDITLPATIDNLTDNSYDVAIHLVSLDHFESNKNPDFVNAVNVMPVWNILNSFKEKKTLDRFIYFSTIHVYGKLPSIKITEAHLPQPRTPYGMTHYMAENICNMFNLSSKIECINFRLSNSFGSPLFRNRNCWSLVVNDMCKSAFEKGIIEIKSDGTALRDFIHYQDIFETLSSVIDLPVTEYKNTFHLSSNITYSIYELAHLVQSVFRKRYGKDVRISILKKSESNQTSEKRYTIDNSGLRAFGANTSMNIEAGILELFDYLDQHGQD
jgi:UDP-glucose 4-epimerase